MTAGNPSRGVIRCGTAPGWTTMATRDGGSRGSLGLNRMTDDGTPDRGDGPAPGGDRPVPLREALAADILAHFPPEFRDPARRGWWARQAIGVSLLSAGFRAACLYRLAHLAHHRGGLPGRWLAGGLSWWGRHWYGCAIDPRARLGGGLILPHPQGIVIGPGATVGPRAWIFQNVSIVGAPGEAGMPRVGADCRIYTGAVLIGPVAVGDGVVLGANVVVSRDVPSWSTARRPPPAVAPLPAAGDGAGVGRATSGSPA